LVSWSSGVVRLKERGKVPDAMQHADNLDAIGERSVENEVLREARHGPFAHVGKSGLVAAVAAAQVRKCDELCEGSLCSTQKAQRESLILKG
jgi:hypothetical protein